MGKLHKRPPPAYPGLHFELLTTVNGAMPYENLPSNTHQPVLMGPDSYQATVSGVLCVPPPINTRISGNTSTTFHPAHRRAMSNQADFQTSPSNHNPIDKRSSLPDISVLAPQLSKEVADIKKPTDLQRLDTKFNTMEPVVKVKEVKVAKDGHEGQQPPAYRRRSTDSTDQRNTGPNKPNGQVHVGHECNSCNKGKRRNSDQLDRRHSCNTCERQRNLISPTQGQHGTCTAHGRSLSETTTIAQRASPSSDRTVGHAPRNAGRFSSCQRCGKYKKPSNAIAEEEEGQVIAESTPAPATDGPVPYADQKPLAVIPPSAVPQINVNGTQINVVPPSASTYQGVTSPFSPHSEDSPLVAKATKAEFKSFRNSAIVRSLSRRLSKRDKVDTRQASVVSPLPSQQLANRGVQSGEESAGHLINMINSAVNHPAGDRNETTDYRQHLDRSIERSKSPFSFMEATTEEEAFELGAVAEDKGPEKPILKAVHNKKEPEIVCTPIYTVVDTEEPAVRQEADHLLDVKNQSAERNFLAVPGAEANGERPGLGRFRSLRGEMTRAASLTRSTSLRRLESLGRSTSLRRLSSLKTVHHNWYREDMALEGVSGESVPVY